MSDTPTTLSPAMEAPQHDGGGHTPLPWFLDPDDREGYEWNIHICNDEARNNRVCFMSNSKSAEANAHLIVTAVNAFESNKRLIDDLVAAGSAVVQSLDEAEERSAVLPEDRDTGKIYVSLGQLRNLRAALSKAKAKPGEQK